MFGGADNTTDTSSGGRYIAPTPDANYTFELHYKYRPASLTAGSDSGTTWLSTKASKRDHNMLAHKYNMGGVRLANTTQTKTTPHETHGGILLLCHL